MDETYERYIYTIVVYFTVNVQSHKHYLFEIIRVQETQAQNICILF